MKKIIKTGLIIVGILLIAMIAVPFLFKDKLVAGLKRMVNEQVDANVDFDDHISISLFRNFPNVSLGIRDLSITGEGEYKGDTLAYVRKLHLVSDLTSLLSKETGIKQVTLTQPFLQLLVDSSGHANWDILKEKEEGEKKEEAATTFKVALQKYTLQDAHLIYSDTSLHTFLEAKGFDHTGKGDFTQDIFNLDTKSKIRELTFAYAGIPYLNRLATDLDAVININLPESKYTLTDTKAKLNGLTLGVNGYVALPNDTDTEMDLKIDAAEADLKNFLSLIPAVYQKNFQDLKATGEVAFNAFAKGVYNENRIPAFDLELSVKNGEIKYASVPEPLSEVNLNLKVNNEDGNLDHTFVEVQQLHFLLGRNPFDAHLTLRHIQTNPFIDGSVKGKLNLADVTKIYPLEKGTELGGVLDLDITAQGEVNAISRKQYDKLKLNGSASANNLLYKSESLGKDIQIPSGNIQFTEQNAHIQNLLARAGTSNLNVNATIDHLQKNPYLDGEIKGKVDLKDVLQIYPLEKGTDLTGKLDLDVKAKGDVNSLVDKHYDKLGLDGNMTIQNVAYHSPSVKNPVNISQGTLHFSPQQVTVKGLKSTVGKSDIAADGGLDNLLGYAFNKQTLKGQLNISSTLLDLNNLMGATEVPAEKGEGEEEAPDTEVKVISIPKDLQFRLKTNIGQFYYGNYDLRNIKGNATVENGVLTLQNLSANTLDGSAELSGTYDTRKADNPQTNIKLNVKDIAISKAFQTFSTVQKFAPIARLASGKFSGNIDISTVLDSNFMPRIQTVNALSNLQLSDFDLKGFAPLQELAGKLGLDKLNQLDIKNLLLAFKIEDGFLTVNPFNIHPGDINILVSGKNGLNKEIDYTLNMEVPRDKLGKIDASLSNLIDQANKSLKGNIDLGETVPLTVKLTGTITQPKIAFDFSEGKKLIENQLKAQAQDKLQEGAGKLLEKLSSTKGSQADSGRAADEKKQEDKSLSNIIDKVVKPQQKENDSTASKKDKPGNLLEDGIKKGLDNLFKKK